MPSERITKRSVDALTPSDKDLFLWDDSLPGFGVKVTPSGHRSYVVQYRPGAGGRRAVAKRIVLGQHGVLTPDEARRRAKQLLGSVAQGEDPSEDRSVEKRRKKVSELGEDYFKEVDARRKPGTAKEYARLWRKHVIPTFGSRKVAEVTAQDIHKLHGSMLRTPYVANRLGFVR